MARVFEPLNPLLYNRMLHRFGRVTVSHAGELPHVFHVTDVFGRQQTHFHGGEYYQVCCPFCHESRFRLYVSYLWGRLDVKHKTYHRTLTICFNEGCLQSQGNNDKLYYEIYGMLDSQTVQNAPLRPGVSVEGRKVGAPGRVAPLRNLPPTHGANAYLLSRGFDPYELSDVYQLGFCEEAAPDYPMMWNRLVIPVYQNQQYVGFQGRALVDIKPKYYNPPGAKKSDWIYNLDIAKHHPVLVLTEGVTKVWRVGPFATALFGRDISQQQLDMITQAAQLADFVVLYLDGNSWVLDEVKNHRAGPRLTYVEKAVRALRLHIPEQKLIVVPLDPTQAPDEFSTAVNRQILLGQLHSRGWCGDEATLMQRRAVSESFRLPSRRSL